MDLMFCSVFLHAGFLMIFRSKSALIVSYCIVCSGPGMVHNGIIELCDHTSCTVLSVFHL